MNGEGENAPVCRAFSVGLSRGSVTLANLFATVASLFFAAVAIDLYRYVIVENAVQSAVERASRCLTPSDAECVSLVSAGSGAESDWYKNVTRTREDLWGKKYEYRANVYEDEWQASYTAFRVRRVEEPPLLVNSAQAVLREFVPEFNQFEHRFARVALTADEKTIEPRFVRGPFPDFDVDFERALDDLSSGQWYPIKRERFAGRSKIIPLPIQMFNWSSQPEIIPAGGEREFVTPQIAVPAIDNQIPCNTSDELCRNISAGPQNTQIDWRNFAFVAIKPFAEVSPAGAKAGSVSWGSSRLGAGLWVDVFDARGNIMSRGQPEMDGHYYCLGGRTEESVTRPRWYNMWLRGPGGANGGTNAICPAGDIDHSGLAVPRGGSFRIHGILSARSADLRGRVSFQYFVDSPIRTGIEVIKTASHDCSSESALNSLGAPAECPPARSCGFEGEVANLKCSVIPGSERSEPICLDRNKASEDRLAIPVPETGCATPIRRLACLDSKFRPTVPTCNPQGRQVCGWHISQSPSAIQVGPRCPSSETSSMACTGDHLQETTYRNDGAYGVVDDCPNAVEKIAQSAKAIETLRTAGVEIEDDIAPLMLADFKRGEASEYIPRKYLYSLSRPHGDQSGVELEEFIFRQSGPIYSRSNKAWNPPSSNFEVVPPPGISFIPGFLETNLKIFRSDTPRRAIFISEVYPFNLDSTFEVPMKQNVDSNCDADDDSQGTDLESRLRKYASRQIPSVLDPDVVFDWTASYRGIAKIDNLGPPACPTVIRRTNETFSDKSSDSYIGRFGAGSVPSECLGSASCRHEPVLSAGVQESYSLQSDLQAARRIGELELLRTLPRTPFGCSSGGCAEMSIEQSSDGDVLVSTVYLLPLSFPTNILIGADKIPISHSSRERMELQPQSIQVD